MDGDLWGRVVYLGLLLAAVMTWAMVEFRRRPGAGLRAAMAWILIFVGVMAGYGLWTDLRQDILPRQMVAEGGEITVPRAGDGHFYLTLEVNGTPLRFMVDTGATNVVLGAGDAARLGIDPAALVFMGQAATANGMVRTARVSLPRVALGPYVDANFPAYVTDGAGAAGGLPHSLLGMDYLRLYRLEIADDHLTLRR